MEFKLEPKHKSEVQFNGRIENKDNWAVPFVKEVEREFEERFEAIRITYEQLMDEVYWNNVVYSAKINFKPVIGKTYHLYKNYKDHFYLSLIAPWEWKMEHMGSFRFEHTGKWIKVG
jgi:hypothetical protein